MTCCEWVGECLITNVDVLEPVFFYPLALWCSVGKPMSGWFLLMSVIGGNYLRAAGERSFISKFTTDDLIERIEFPRAADGVDNE